VSGKNRTRGGYREPETLFDRHRPAGPPQARESKSQKAQLEVMPPGPNKDVKRKMAYKTGLFDWREKARLEAAKREAGGFPGQVQEALDRDRNLRGYGLKADVREGRVRLTGIVDTLADKERAAALVATLPGVKAVENGIAVSTDGAVDDADITREAEEELAAEPAVDLRRIGVEARGGTVFLVGKARNRDEAMAARRAAARARGVRNVVSRLAQEGRAGEPATLEEIFHSQVRNDRENGPELGM
jgi:hyperosmotically inducible protein